MCSETTVESSWVLAWWVLMVLGIGLVFQLWHAWAAEDPRGDRDETGPRHMQSRPLYSDRRLAFVHRI
jgi:hypothetical protein